MKKRFTLLLVLLLLVILCACKEEPPPDPVNLLADVPADERSISFYIYDGNYVYRNSLWSLRKAIDELSAVEAYPVEDWSYDDLTLPIYAFQIFLEDDWISVACSNGLWITPDGSAYSVDYDISTLCETWVETDSSRGFFYSFPCARALCMDDGRWVAERMQPAGDPPRSGTIAVELAGVTADRAVSYTMTNKSAKEYSYGASHRLEVLLDGQWYVVPYRFTHVGFPSIAYLLPAGDTVTKTLQLGNEKSVYGILPNGQYRIVIQEGSVEFTLD